MARNERQRELQQALNGAHITPESVEAERGSVKDSAESYRLKTDGSTIDAVPQRDGLTEYTGQSDIGPLLDTLIEDELTPAGTIKEANGKITLTTGDYPGDLSNGTYDGIPLAAQLVLKGENVTHSAGAQSVNTIPTANVGTRLTFSSAAMFTPSVDNDFAIYPRVEDIQFDGPGGSVTGSIGIDGTGSNVIDWAYFIRLVIQNVETPFDMGSSNGHKEFHSCQIRNFGGQANLDKRSYFFGGAIHAGSGGSVLVDHGHIEGADLTGIGESGVVFTVQNDGTIADCRFRKDSGGTDSSGTLVTLNGDQCKFADNKLIIPQSGDSLQYWITVSGGSKHIITGNVDTTDTSYSLKLGGTDIIVDNNSFTFNIQDGGTRPRVNGTVELGTAPTGSNYGRDDRGLTILDTSQTPTDIYYVLNDGTVDGPL